MKKFLPEVSGVRVPVKEQPDESDPVMLPFEEMVTVVVVPSSRTPVQVPLMSDTLAAVL